MFLKEITINNFRSIQKATIGFEPGLNILIGKNGSGKSNLLAYIISKLYYFFEEYNRFDYSHLFKGTNTEIEFTLSYDKFDEDGKVGKHQATEYSFYLKRDRIVNAQKEIEPIVEFTFTKRIEGKVIYDEKKVAPPNIKREDLKFFRESHVFNKFGISYVLFSIPNGTFWLETGVQFSIDNVRNYNREFRPSEFSILRLLEYRVEYAFLSDVTSSDKLNVIEDISSDFLKLLISKTIEALLNDFNVTEHLSKHSPITGLRINPNINIYHTENKLLIENLLIDFKVNNSWVPWSYLSDGTKRLFYLITEVLLNDKGIVLIEEPELGIHPQQLFSLMDFIKAQSAYKQIIISTHSPIVLDVLGPNELNKITIVKLGDHGTYFEKLTEEQKEKARQYMEETDDLSNYWLHSDLEND